jgi:hypothetical protein
MAGLRVGKAVLDLARIDQRSAPALAEIDAIEFRPLVCDPYD